MATIQRPTHYSRLPLLPIALAGTVSALGLLIVAISAHAAESPAVGAPVDFAKDVRPIFAQNCYRCHDGDKRKGGLQLDVKERALAGGDSGDKAITPGEPEKSKLIHLVRGDNPKEVMPPKGKGDRLTPEQIDVLTRWIKQGATWPDGV